MHGTSTALVILVPEAEALFGAFRRAHDSAAAKGGPAHITLLYPFLHDRALLPDIRAKLAKVFQDFEPFFFSLTHTSHFRGVLHLTPEPAAPFAALTQAIWAAFPDHPPYDGRFSEIRPHMQLAQDDDEGTLLRLDREFNQQFGAALPLQSRATQAHLIGERNGQWHSHWTFPLGRGLDR